MPANDSVPELAKETQMTLSNSLQSVRSSGMPENCETHEVHKTGAWTLETHLLCTAALSKLRPKRPASKGFVELLSSSHGRPIAVGQFGALKQSRIGMQVPMKALLSEK